MDRQRIRKLDGKIMIDLSDVQSTPLGELIGHLHYSNRSLYELAPSPTGYPHNGGQHTLTIKGEPHDVIAYLEIMIETYGSHRRFKKGVEELESIRRFAQLASRYMHVPQHSI